MFAANYYILCNETCVVYRPIRLWIRRLYVNITQYIYHKFNVCKQESLVRTIYLTQALWCFALSKLLVAVALQFALGGGEWVGCSASECWRWRRIVCFVIYGWIVVEDYTIRSTCRRRLVGSARRKDDMNIGWMLFGVCVCGLFARRRSLPWIQRLNCRIAGP